MITHRDRLYTITCDRCGAKLSSPGLFSLYAILDAQGWLHRQGAHLCDRCREGKR